MEQQPIEIALVDVRMPDLDGLELLRDAEGRWPDVPVIMLSSYDQAQYVKRALAEGAAGYMLKDATTDDLGQAIRSRCPAAATCSRRASSRTCSRTATSRVPARAGPPAGVQPDPPRDATSWRCSPRAGATATSRAPCSCRRRP